VTPLERDALENAVREYLANGYEVEREVDLEGINPRLRSMRVDLVARRGNETVIVEIKSRQSAQNSNLEDLATAVDAMGSNFRLDVVWIGNDESVPSFEDVVELMERVARWVEFDSKASILLGWAALECAMRRCATNHEFVGPATYGRQLAADLYGNRVVGSSLYATLNEICKRTRQSAHGQSRGARDEASEKAATRRAVELAKTLAAESYIALDEATQKLSERLTRDEIEMLAIKELWPESLTDRVRSALDQTPYDPESVSQIASRLYVNPKNG